MAQAADGAGAGVGESLSFLIGALGAGFFVLVLLATCLTCLQIVFTLPHRARPSVPWTGWGVTGLLLLFVFCQTLGATAAASLKAPSPWGALGAAQAIGSASLGDGAGAETSDAIFSALATRAQLEFAVWPLTGAMLGELVFLAIMIASLRRSGASWDDLGLARTEWLTDANLAKTAFFGVIPISLVLQGVLVKLLGDDARQHPLIEMLRESPPVGFWIASGLTAVIVAPIVEEMVFRVLLQGWLTRKENEGSSGGWIPGHRGWGPILIASVIFAAIHANAWPAPIPLFFVALALGRLYDATGRAAPAIMLHMALNGFSFALLLITTLNAPPDASEPTKLTEPTSAATAEATPGATNPLEVEPKKTEAAASEETAASKLN
ncbi:MAG TPA: CPBP family intramembrane glutamic endopeptidase [Pirellulales bacterium]